MSNWRLVKMSGRPSSPADDPGPCPDVVRVVPAHQPDLEPDPGSLDGGQDRVGLGQVERQRLLAQDVAAGGRGGLDDRAVVDRRDRDQHRIDARRADRVERVREGCGPADLVGQPAGRGPIDITDRHDPQLGCARGDEPGMVAPHPPGADERQPDPRRQWISSIRTDRASRSDVVAAIAIRVAS